MSIVYFISDPHFGHTNLNFVLRGMTNEEADELIIKNWNTKVKSPNDIVYVVGDFCMEKPALISQYYKRLNGTIVLIGGNHDNRKCCAEFQRLGIVVMGALEYKGFIVTHIPVDKHHAKEYRGNIHGHIHSFEIPSSLYLSVVPELNNYTPLTFEELIAKQKHKKTIKSYISLSYLKFKFICLIYRKLRKSLRKLIQAFSKKL